MIGDFLPLGALSTMKIYAKHLVKLRTSKMVSRLVSVRYARTVDTMRVYWDLSSYKELRHETTHARQISGFPY